MAEPETGDDAQPEGPADPQRFERITEEVVAALAFYGGQGSPLLLGSLRKRRLRTELGYCLEGIKGRYQDAHERRVGLVLSTCPVKDAQRQTFYAL